MPTAHRNKKKKTTGQDSPKLDIPEWETVDAALVMAGIAEGLDGVEDLPVVLEALLGRWEDDEVVWKADLKTSREKVRSSIV